MPEGEIQILLGVKTYLIQLFFMYLKINWKSFCFLKPKQNIHINQNVYPDFEIHFSRKEYSTACDREKMKSKKK